MDDVNTSESATLNVPGMRTQTYVRWNELILTV